MIVSESGENRANTSAAGSTILEPSLVENDFNEVCQILCKKSELNKKLSALENRLVIEGIKNSRDSFRLKIFHQTTISINGSEPSSS